MKKTALLTVIILVVGLAACTKAPQGGFASSSASLSEAAPSSISAPPPVLEGVFAENYPRVDGSTANIPMMALIYSKICGVSVPDAELIVDVTTTAPSWRSMMNNEADLLLVYEAPESVKADIFYDNLDIQPLGRDALVFITNAGNSVQSLTQRQLKDIYTGKVTNWQEVGGEALAIKAFQRDEESGSQTLFKKLLMQDLIPMQAPTELAPATMGGLIDALADFDGSGEALGYSVYYYAKEMYTKPNLKLIGVDGVIPSTETIKSGEYPLTNEFYVVIRASEPENSPARLLRDWILSPEGTKTILQAGYVSVRE